MFKNKNEKEQMALTCDLLKKEQSLIEREKMVEINATIQQKKETIWKLVDESRVKWLEKNVELKSEIAKLEAKKESFTVEVEMLRAENKFLRETISLFAKNQSKKNIC